MSERQIETIAIDNLVSPMSSGHPTGIHIVTPSGRLDDAVRKELAKIHAFHGIQEHLEYNEDSPFMEINPGCGGSLIIPTMNDFPETDVPCTCGDPAGYLIKYEKMEKPL